MIYIFGNEFTVSIVYDETTLKVEEKVSASCVLAVLPQKPAPTDETIFVPYVDPITKQFGYVEKEKPFGMFYEDYIKTLVDKKEITKGQGYRMLLNYYL